MPTRLRELFRAGSTDHPADHELVGLLEPGLEFDGKMTVSSGMVRLNTHFKGEIHCAGTVIVADRGEMEGEIHSKFVSVGGKVKGAVHAAEKIEIKSNGVVLGEIYTASLILEPGGYFNGHCHMPDPVPATDSVEAVQKV
jgi:cytoskeletal protein CcmA (bactofilin family)